MNEVHDVDDSECGYFIFISLRAISPALSLCVCHPSESVQLLSVLLTPWCRVLLEKLTGLELVKIFPAFQGTRMFITALTSVRQLSLSWVSPSSPYTHILPPGDPS